VIRALHSSKRDSLADNITGSDNFLRGRFNLAPFAADALPMPLVLVVAAGARHVQKNASETGLSELSLHNGFLSLCDSIIFYRGDGMVSFTQTKPGDGKYHPCGEYARPKPGKIGSRAAIEECRAIGERGVPRTVTLNTTSAAAIKDMEAALGPYHKDVLKCQIGFVTRHDAGFG